MISTVGSQRNILVFQKRNTFPGAMFHKFIVFRRCVSLSRGPSTMMIDFDS